MRKGSVGNNRKHIIKFLIFLILPMTITLISYKIGVILRISAIELVFYTASAVMVLWVTCLFIKYKQKWITLFYFLPISILLITPFFGESLIDHHYSFEKSDQTIGVIIPDFESHLPKDGAAFAEKLHTQLLNKIMRPRQITVGDTTLSLEIKVQKVDARWDTNQMKIRGRRREANLGVIGSYRRYYENGESKEEVSDFKVVILDTMIASIFKEEKPFGQLHEFIINLDDITVNQQDSLKVEEKASLPIEYLINMAGNASLLQQAIQAKGWARDRILSTLHERITNLGKLTKNPSLACFHHGNSLVRTAMNPQLQLPDRRRFFEDASRIYKESIYSLSLITRQILLKQYRPWRTYLNLAWTYMQLDSITDNSAFKDSAEAVYDSVVARYSNRETLEEQHTFLSERCEEEFVAPNVPSSINRAEQLYNKYKHCADKLKIEIRTKSRQLSKKDQEILDKIEENEEYFEAHLKKLRQLQQGV